jgi:putative phosphoribosyl transferase
MARTSRTEAVLIEAAGALLPGDLEVPSAARALVLFAHGSGSGRRSPRNQQVARELRAAGLATLLFDLLDAQEALEDSLSMSHRFDIELLAARMVSATDWLRSRAELRRLALGYFGASTGAAAALIAAADRAREVGAVVSRGGRPDLAGAVLADVRAPTLLVVGGNDREVMKLNQAAFKLLRCPRDLQSIPGASHLFEEPGALAAVTALARQWFVRHLLGERGVDVHASPGA